MWATLKNNNNEASPHIHKLSLNVTTSVRSHMLHVATFIVFSQSFYTVSLCHCIYCTIWKGALTGVYLIGIVLYALNANGMIVFDKVWCVS